MLRDEKWIEYAIDILVAVDDGAQSIAGISENIDGSESYIAKVVAVLRKSGLIDKKYNLSKSLDDITVKEIVLLTHSYDRKNDLMDRITDRMLNSLNISIRDLISG